MKGKTWEVQVSHEFTGTFLPLPWSAYKICDSDRLLFFKLGESWSHLIYRQDHDSGGKTEQGFLGIYLEKKRDPKDACLPVLIAALFTTAKTWTT